MKEMDPVREGAHAGGTPLDLPMFMDSESGVFLELELELTQLLYFP